MALVWLIGGLLLIAGEVVIPGLVAVFLGVAALLVAGGVWLGLIGGLPTALVVWVVTSLGLILSLRRVATKFLPADYTRESTNEELSAYGTLVEVIEGCDDAGTVGRIRYQGTSWPAKCIDGRVQSGQQARLLYQDKDGLGWVVEPLDALPAATNKS